MKRHRLLAFTVAIYFILVGVVGASFAHQGCNAPCCQGDAQNTCHLQAASGPSFMAREYNGQSHSCHDKIWCTAEKSSAPASTCRSFCPHTVSDIDDCECSLKTEDSEYLPVASFLPTDSPTLLVCWVDDVIQQKEIPDGPYAAEGSHGKITSPLFLRNSVLLL